MKQNQVVSVAAGALPTKSRGMTSVGSATAQDVSNVMVCVFMPPWASYPCLHQTNQCSARIVAYLHLLKNISNRYGPTQWILFFNANWLSYRRVYTRERWTKTKRELSRLVRCQRGSQVPIQRVHRMPRMRWWVKRVVNITFCSCFWQKSLQYPSRTCYSRISWD